MNKKNWKVIEKKAQIANWNKTPSRKRDKKGNIGPNRKEEIKILMKYGK